MRIGVLSSMIFSKGGLVVSSYEMKKIIFSLLFLPLVAHLMNLFLFHFRERFHPREFEHGFHPSYSQTVSQLDYAALDPILSQPFHYLGHGKQMLALESEDGKYVLKIFNPMRPFKKQWYKHWRYWKRYSSLKWIKREWFTKKDRLKKLFNRHKIAYEHLKDETGLIFVHLKPDPRICHLVSVTDHLGKQHILALHDTPFVLQRKAILVPTYLSGLIEQGKHDEAHLAVARVEELFDRRIEEGITDRIQTMENNFGFVEGKAVQIDVGRIRKFPSLDPEEKERVMKCFESWLAEAFPTLSVFSLAGT